MSNFFPLFLQFYFFSPFLTLSLKKKNPQSYKPKIFEKSGFGEAPTDFIKMIIYT